jgi:hypothetical protein
MKGKHMSPERIIALYDSKPDLTLRQLSRITGWAVSELKTLLHEV